MLGSKTTHCARPAAFARYMAMSASRNSDSGVASGSGTTMPLLAATGTRGPPRAVDPPRGDPVAARVDRVADDLQQPLGEVGGLRQATAGVVEQDGELVAA